jgi:hypothetical protein
MPRRNINAEERLDRRWSPDYIRALMRKLKGNKIEQAYDEPAVKKDMKRKDKKKNG